jgi:hypothetical protein
MQKPVLSTSLDQIDFSSHIYLYIRSLTPLTHGQNIPVKGGNVYCYIKLMTQQVKKELENKKIISCEPL